jgi:DNA-binding CsgD family transcriptional regulator
MEADMSASFAGALQTLESVATAPNPAEALRTFAHLLAPHLGDNISYAFGGMRGEVGPMADPNGVIMIGTPEAEEWSRRCFTEPQHRLHHPVCRHVVGSIEMLDWSELARLPDAAQAERRMWRELRDLGIEGGLTFPVHEPAIGRFGCVTIRCESDLGRFRAFAHANAASLQAAVLHFHSSLRGRFSAPAISDDGLSPREREVLLWVANGLVTKAIARRLNLSPRTIDLHVARAMKKLGARTRSEAASLAVMQGRIVP